MRDDSTKSKSPGHPGKGTVPVYIDKWLDPRLVDVGEAVDKPECPSPRFSRRFQETEVGELLSKYATVKAPKLLGK